MQISGYGAVSQSAWPTEQKRRSVYGQPDSGSRGDTVAFSDEALALLEQMKQAKADAVEKQTKAPRTKTEEEKSGQDLLDEGTAAAKNPDDVKAWATGSSGQSGFGDTAGEHSEEKAAESSMHEKNKAAANSSSSSSDTIEGIEEQIEKLKGKVKELAESMNKILSNESMPIETREQMVKPIEDQINQLMAQVGQLESKKAEMVSQQQAKG